MHLASTALAINSTPHSPLWLTLQQGHKRTKHSFPIIKYGWQGRGSMKFGKSIIIISCSKTECTFLVNVDRTFDCRWGKCKTDLGGRSESTLGFLTTECILLIPNMPVMQVHFAQRRDKWSLGIYGTHFCLKNVPDKNHNINIYEYKNTSGSEQLSN